MDYIYAEMTQSEEASDTPFSETGHVMAVGDPLKVRPKMYADICLMAEEAENV